MVSEESKVVKKVKKKRTGDVLDAASDGGDVSFVVLEDHSDLGGCEEAMIESQC